MLDGYWSESTSLSAAEQINPEQVERELTEFLAGFADDPLGFVESAYTWNYGDLPHAAGPRRWQREILATIRDHLRGPNARTKPLRIAVASGNGIGKSALVGWLIGWALSTHVDARAKITASKGEQLATKTVPETSKWFRNLINAHWWEVRAQSIKVKDPHHRDTWRADFETWSEENTEGFAGLHNQGKIILLLMDEASGIPDAIWEVSDTALTDANTIIIWVAFGNPTRNSGRFRECFGGDKGRWITFQVDSRTVEGTNHDIYKEMVEKYGEDHDYVRVHVKGEFPRTSDLQFIPSELVAIARKYTAQGYANLPKILSVDVARQGADQTVIGWRQGRKSVILGRYRGSDNVQVAERTIAFMETEKPDATVIDGDGLGAGVVDHIKARGYDTRLFEFHGGGKPFDSAAYYNKRAEVWGLMRDWLRDGAEIPDDPELAADLTTPEYGLRGDHGQIQLERKDDMRKRGLNSPDCADMLAMTFAVKVNRHQNLIPKQISHDYGSQGWLA